MWSGPAQALTKRYAPGTRSMTTDMSSEPISGCAISLQRRSPKSPVTTPRAKAYSASSLRVTG